MKLNRLVKVLAAVAVIFGACNSAYAQDIPTLGIFNHLGINLNAGTTGIGVEAATPITQFVQARAGISVMPGIKFHVNSEVNATAPDGQTYYEDVRLEGSLKRVQGSLVFNVYPFGNRSSFFVAAGAYFGGKDMVKISGHVNDWEKYKDAGVQIGDYNLPIGPDGNVEGALRVNSFRPYFGIGTGRPCPKGRVNFMWELGVQIQKTPYVYDVVNSSKIDVAEFSSDDTFQKIMDNIKVYPVLKLTISGRIF